MNPDGATPDRTLIAVQYDPAWPELFRLLRDRLWPSLTDPAVAIEHVGSTAAPGITAKPVIDLDVVIGSRADLPETVKQLQILGYRHQGGLGIPGRDAFRAPEDQPAHHLCVCPAEIAALCNHIAFRDYLRAHPAVAAEYCALKIRLATQFSSDIDRYTAAKTEFILSMLSRSGLADEHIDQIRCPNGFTSCYGAVTADRLCLPQPKTSREDDCPRQPPEVTRFVGSVPVVS